MIRYLWRKTGDALERFYWRLVTTRERIEAKYPHFKRLPPDFIYRDDRYEAVHRSTLHKK
jgi:hypothetical protein